MAVFSQTKIKKLIVVAGIITLVVSCNPISTFATTNTEQDSSCEVEITNPTRAVIWVYKVVDGYVYKRLYNKSTGQWIGDWILVGPV